MKKKTYNHAFTMAFSLDSEHAQGDDITPEQYRRAIEKKMDELDEGGKSSWLEMMGYPYDTYEN